MKNDIPRKGTQRKRFTYLKEFVYGGIDGSVTTFAVVAGATGAKLDAGVIIVLGFANLIADGFSMSVGNYLSEKSELAKANKNVSIRHPSSPYRTAGATFISFIIMGLVPLAVYIYSYMKEMRAELLFPSSCALTGISFLVIGILRSRVTKARWHKSILETLLLGGIAAVLAYCAGSLLKGMISEAA
jgi:VIT1/CCC1 family predicted Fe2+/Mn2+ transporter